MRSDGSLGCGGAGWRICAYLMPWIPGIFGGAAAAPAVGGGRRLLASAANDGDESGRKTMARPRGRQLAVVGLGNPGRQFTGTRHNVGFDIVTQLAAVHRATFKRDRALEAEVATIELGERAVRLVKPSTYMNASGRTVRKLKLPRAALLIVADDMALGVGRVKLRPSGSAGGHNGLKSVEQAVGGRDYARLRVGVGEASGGAAGWKEHVLGGFSRAERDALEGVYIDCVNVIEAWVKDDDMKAATDLLSRLMGQRRK